MKLYELLFLRMCFILQMTQSQRDLESHVFVTVLALNKEDVYLEPGEAGPEFTVSCILCGPFC
jgi:hypothetical protein